MFDLKRLNFSRIADAQPKRFQKVNLAAARIEPQDDPQYIVSRAESDSAHVVKLVSALSHYWGTCSCDGFKYNDGACSHLCGVKRAADRDLVEIASAEPTALSVEMHDDQTELAQHASEPERRPATDGGRRQ